MNLMKLFNFNYFKENLKKSKGVLAFFFGVIPLINIIMLIIVLNNANLSEDIITFSLDSLSVITFLGVYLVPLIFAVSLFGFIFRRRSVDFVMSKPISRKSLYVTNILGGIGIICLFVLVNIFVFSIFALIFNRLIIPFNLLYDYLILILVSYIFVFSLSVLAITLAGNIMSSLVLFLIILIIYPFFIGIDLAYMSSNENTYLKCTENTCKPINYDCYDEEACEEKLANNYYHLNLSKTITDKLTTPVSFVIRENNNTFILNFYVIIKMLVLSTIYLVIGGFAFQKRKMENNETDFKSEFIHYFVKTITMLPVAYISYLMIENTDFIGIIVSIIASLIYYTIYDILTRKEIYRPLKSAIICLITLAIYVGCYNVYKVYSNKRSILIDNIDKIVIPYQTDNLTIKDKNVINELIKDNLDNQEYYNNSYIYSNNKKYYTYLTVNDNLKIKLDKLYLEQKRLENRNFDWDKADYIRYDEYNILMTKELKKILKNTYKEVKSSDTNNYVYIYNYQNHKRMRVTLDLTNNSELFDYINQELIIRYKNILANDFKLYIPDMGATINNYEKITDYEYVFTYVIEKNLDKFLNYLENNNTNLNGPKLIISSTYNYNYYYYNKIIINDEIAFKKEYDKYKESLKGDLEFQRLLKYQEEEQNEYKN